MDTGLLSLGLGIVFKAARFIPDRRNPEPVGGQFRRPSMQRVGSFHPNWCRDLSINSERVAALLFCIDPCFALDGRQHSNTATQQGKPKPFGTRIQHGCSKAAQRGVSHAMGLNLDSTWLLTPQKDAFLWVLWKISLD